MIGPASTQGGATSPHQAPSNTPPPTEYVILEAGDGVFTLTPGTQSARSSDQAVKQHAQALAAEGGDPDGTYVAIPARSWKPTTVKVETTFKIGDAA